MCNYMKKVSSTTPRNVPPYQSEATMKYKKLLDHKVDTIAFVITLENIDTLLSKSIIIEKLGLNIQHDSNVCTKLPSL